MFTTTKRRKVSEIISSTVKFLPLPPYYANDNDTEERQDDQDGLDHCYNDCHCFISVLTPILIPAMVKKSYSIDDDKVCEDKCFNAIVPLLLVRLYDSMHR